MSLFEELKRRRVIRALFVYLVAAWAIIQVADTVVPNIGLPQWTVTLVILLAALGLPIALVLAWLFDVTPAGVQRTPATTLSSSRALGFVGVGMLLSLVGFGAYWRVQPARDADETNSIAVLPFVDMSPNGDQEYLGDGITEEVLNALAQIEGLRVPARTTSFAFKGKDMPVTEIAQQLGVVHVLEGSVRKSGDMVRITAQLIDARKDKHLWSEQYDLELDDVFAVQEQITKTIVDMLKLKLSEARLVGRETASGKAHEHYLRGLYYWNRRHGDEMRLALREFKEATQLDPRYARAWAGLALTYAVLPQYMVFDPAEASKKGHEAAARALELDAKAADAHAALSQIAQELDWDWKASLAHADEAVKLDRNYATAHQWRAEILMIMNKCNEALDEVERAIEIDPLNSVMQNVRGLILSSCGRTEEAHEVFKAVDKRDPGFSRSRNNTYITAMLLGRYQEAERLAADSGSVFLARAAQSAPARQAMLTYLHGPGRTELDPIMRSFSYAMLNEPDSALVILTRTLDKRLPNAGVLVSWMRRFDHSPHYPALLRKLGLHELQ